MIFDFKLSFPHTADCLIKRLSLYRCQFSDAPDASSINMIPTYLIKMFKTLHKVINSISDGFAGDILKHGKEGLECDSCVGAINLKINCFFNINQSFTCCCILSYTKH